MKKISFISLFSIILLLSGYSANAQNGARTSGGVTFGYVNQIFRIHYGEKSFFDNGVWDDGFDKRTHGGFLGFLVCHPFGESGFSFNWALWTCLYHSSNKPPETDAEILTSPNEIWTDYFEWTLNVPLHLQYAIPNTNTSFNFGFHTGPAYTVSFVGDYSDDRGYYDEYSIFKSISRHNFTYDIAFFVQMTALRFDFVWSRGLNAVLEDEDISFYRNTFMTSVTIMF